MRKDGHNENEQDSIRKNTKNPETPTSEKAQKILFNKFLGAIFRFSMELLARDSP